MISRTNLVLLAIIVALILSLLTCNSCKNAEIAKLKGQPQGAVKETVRIDTVWKHSRDTLYKSKLQPYAVYRQKTDTLIEFIDREVLVQLLDTALYRDSAQVQYGKVYINDTITRNRIAGRSVITDFTIPEITNTITRTIEQPKRVKGYLVGSVVGSYHDPLQAVGGGFMLQFRNDNAVEVQGLFGRGWVPQWKGQTFQVSYKHKLSFK